ncbi:prepilin-type N-terminal cleavage/methylation domain-containing protein [Actinoplanes sp. NPDC051346]|uniref:PulJ/GspJ family protein n=1 Tax=Actinoplanes sp. NPDC051346 TaxID=3155048 RepID=UPI003446C239
MSDDAGFTLLELMVALAILSVAMAIFTTGTLQLFRGTSKIESASIAQSQLQVAFERLDREIRYASALSIPAVVNGDPYVEYRTENSGTAMCTELRLHAADQQLQRRTWVEGPAPITPTPWIPLASGISAAAAGTDPFTFVPTDDTYGWQRLTIDLSAASGGEGSSATSKASKVTITALNTSPNTSITDVCTAGRTVP